MVCSDQCDFCIYIGEGDFIYDILQDIVIEDWVPVFENKCPMEKEND